MEFLSSLLGILGFGIGFLLGVLIGFYFFIYSQPTDVEDPVVSPLCELDTDALQDLIPDIPLWVKSPDYDRVDWLNKFLQNMWPFLDKAICSTIRSVAEPIFAEYIGQYTITKIDFETLTPGTLPPVLQGLKVYETNERELVMEPAIKWAGNPNIVVVVTSSSLQNLKIKLQLVDLQIFVAPRVTLKPLVPSFPCFANITVSIMEKPHVDFGLKVLGGDVMAIPGLYRYVQEIIKKQVAVLYHWPQTLEIPVLDASLVGIKKPVGILHVKVVRAMKLLKMDLLGLSDPYVKLSLSGDSLPSRKTSIKKKNLNPEWNESFKLTVKDPQSQILHLDVIDWDKVGAHDRLGSQLLPLKLLQPNETKEFTLDLLKNSSISVAHDKKQRGQIVVELTYAPFREDTDGMSGPLNSFSWKENGLETISGNDSPRGAGLLFVTVQGAKDVEGSRHNNPYVVIFFRGEKRKSKMVKRTRDPQWCEEFHFMLEEPPVHEKIHLEVLSKRNGISFRSKESLGHVDINLDDVVHNGRINEKYHLIDSKNGVIHVELRWKSI
ncbi:PREDICTED: synaptotagmin-3 [Nicotiana attenuata]|uniref:Synaptotagmin-3 n=1 Tax=Nicotiana attenuata TaxID=49451 RepID=A0A314KPX9_NICAT|nr:PREDICTED: synaptotagmin-3 [Nicotiana attenuata]XP_019227535.1 PREDICTED: synaptotagmin-3 [Nicotiana attenuata]XP_019227536.1 PREDICTED: synaptotagmin-3 [Nicotiana attenuata]XP_019227537.1 PREDICTED: synaptotagmin-3 [Nicotiana attenuata]OIT31322.1 synaptotagmin-3 [Nicotiana attenuata]